MAQRIVLKLGIFANLLIILLALWQFRDYRYYVLFKGDTSRSPLSDDCAAHGFEDYEGTRKVYDLLLMYNELDFLEIRLHTLDHVVDWFVIIEAPTTFSGIPKSLFLEDHWDRFKMFHHKIIYQVVDAGNETDHGWAYEHFLRNRLLKVAEEAHDRPQYGDMIIVSDLDEIPRPEAVAMLRKCVYPSRTSLYSRFFYYSYQWRHERLWYHPQVTEYRNEETIPPQDLRIPPNDIDSAIIADAGWHCSSCFKTIKQVQDKLAGFSHSDVWSTEENRDAATIVERFRNGLDLYGREEEKYQRYPVIDIPPYVKLKENAQRFRYLTDRTGPAGGFEDIAAYLPGFSS